MIRQCEHCGESYSYAHTCPSEIAKWKASMPTVEQIWHAALPRVVKYGPGEAHATPGDAMAAVYQGRIAELETQVRLLTGRLRDVQRAIAGWEE